MNICVFCSSSDQADARLLEQGARLGRTLAERGHGLVYGGTPMGTMRALVHAARDAGSRVVGVAPRFMRELGITDDGCDELVITDDLLERKRVMLARSDGFIGLPGGLGTIDEALEAITHVYLGQLTAPVVLLDSDHFWDVLLTLIRDLQAHHLSQVAPHELVEVASTPEDAVVHIEQALGGVRRTVWQP